MTAVQTADILNESFVSIKVDKEERPDVDHLFMTYLQATQGGGGWWVVLLCWPAVHCLGNVSAYGQHHRISC